MSTYVYLTHKTILLKLGSVAMSLAPIVQSEEEEFAGGLGCLGTSFHKQSPHKEKCYLTYRMGEKSVIALHLREN